MLVSIPTGVKVNQMGTLPSRGKWPTERSWERECGYSLSRLDTRLHPLPPGDLGKLLNCSAQGLLICHVEITIVPTS